MVGAVKQKKQAGQPHNRVGQAVRLGRVEGQLNPVGQGEDAGQGGQRVHACLAPQGPAQSGA